MTKPQYLIGIDLGTSNCVLAYRQIGSSEETQVLPILQWDESGTVRRNELPSVLWSLEKGAVKRGEGRLPFHADDSSVSYKLGIGARTAALKHPDRVIHSSKSWLAHNGINPKAPILPWNSDSLVGSSRISPFDAAAVLLKHLKDCWDYDIAAGHHEKLFEQQIVVITVPASFDLKSQQLTLEAAHAVGFPENTSLLEEPLAAYYSWQDKNSSNDGDEQTVLVCDIGGGTTDFSLLRKTTGTTAKRLRVSPHLLLGGDNIDQAIAQQLELLFADTKLGSYEWAQLANQARLVKETFLSSEQDSFHVSLHKSSAGSSLFGQTLSGEIHRDEVIKVCESFFPLCSPEAKPKNSGSLSEWGLPYAEDPAITHHLADFLNGRPVDQVLFAGGSMNSSALRKLMMDAINSWQKSPVKQLDHEDMSLAIAKGSVAYLEATQTGEKLVEATFPRNLYIKVESTSSSPTALCILAKGQARGEPSFLRDHNLKAKTNSTALFELYWDERSKVRTGELIQLDQNMRPISRVICKLQSSEKHQQSVAVSLEAVVEQTGAFSLNCIGPNQERWPLLFDLNPEKQVRKLSTSNLGTHQSMSSSEHDLLRSLYGKGKPKVGVTAKQITKSLEQASGVKRKDWDVSYLRQLWSDLAEGMTRKGRSLDHETSWLYLAGYSLRPGFGHPDDEEAIDQLWRVFQLGLSFPKEKSSQEQWWILWRRVSGGLSRDRQELLFDKIFPSLKKGRASSHQQYLLAGSLERVDTQKKIALGQALVDQILSGNKDMVEAKLWCLARLSSRVPMYSGPEHVLRPVNIEKWAQQLDQLSLTHRSYKQVSLFYRLAGRFVGDREFDLTEETRHLFVKKLQTLGSRDEDLEPILKHVEITVKDQADLFGEELPVGLTLN